MLGRVVVVVALMIVVQRAEAGDRVAGAEFATRSEVIAKNGMACTSQPLATQVAIDVLKRGGNAVDAAIAANAALCVMEPTGCGLGGDLFAIVWDAEAHELVGLNGSGRSPRALTLERLRELGVERIPPRGPLPVTVPGCVDAWFALHERFGKLPLADVLAPAIAHARDGYPVSPVIAHYWKANARVLAECEGFAEQFMPGGRAPAAGEVFANPNLARTLEVLAGVARAGGGDDEEHATGRDAFYRGPLARIIAATVQRQGGYLAVEDLAAHRSEWVTPISTDYRGYEVCELPPNGQGITALQMLEILEGFDVAALGFDSPARLHAFVEAKKLAFSDRARFVADPAFTEVPVAALLSDAYAAKRRALVDAARAAKSVDPGNPALAEGDTIYLTTADRAGNVVSLIQSNYRGMGSGVCPDGLGFVLQDRGELFDLAEGRPNTYAPSKRPFHTIIPAFVLKGGEPFLSFGVMGGAMQPQGHAQIVMNLVDFGMNVQEAGDAPRVRHEGSSEPTGETMTDGGTVFLESGFGDDVVRALEALGHRIVREPGGFGGYQAILVDRANGVYRGASESRTDGQAAGY